MLPQILIIHLNRFEKTLEGLKKNPIAVDFPLTLDVGDYLLANTESCEYKLYAIANHYGTIEAGHYTAYCKNSTLNK